MQYRFNVLSTPFFDRSSSTRALCYVGLGASWSLAIACIIAGAVECRTRGPVVMYFKVPIAWKYGARVILLAQIVLITACNESLGHIHSITLRWALQKEGRLIFNSNLRLLSSSRNFWPNKWPCNILVLCGITATYAASSMLYVRDWTPAYPDLFLACYPFIAIGCGFAVQAAVVTWAVALCRDIPSWSSNLMDTSAACLAINPGLEHRPGRCLRGVNSTTSSTEPVYPQHQQVSAYSAHKEIRPITWFLWLCVTFGLIWAIILIAKNPQPLSNHCAWSLFDSVDCAKSDIWQGGIIDENSSREGNFVANFFVICALQATFTMAQHCAELLVNCSRDESNWRRISSKSGTKRTSNALVALLTSWQGLTLFCMKALIQWLFSLTYLANGVVDIYFAAPPVIYFTTSLLLLATFSTVIVFRRPKGPQPATYGHLQSLVDMIDEWPEAKDRIYWGHKGVKEGIAHAGTSWRPLAAIHFDKPYA